MTAQAQAKPAAKPAAKKPAGKTVVIVQTGSENRKAPGMRETLRGLGLGRIHSRRELEDTPAVRGMINKVRHLVRVEEKGK